MTEMIEFTTCGVMLICSLIIAHNWAKYGLLEVGIQKPANMSVIMAAFVGMISYLIAGLLQKHYELKFSFLTGDNLRQASLIMLGVPFVWLILKRNLFMPKGQFNYNRAIIRTTHWSLTSYRPGEKLAEQGDILRSFGIAIKTLEYFKEAIAVQEKGVSMVSDASPKVIDLETVELTHRNTVHSSCPVCCMPIEAPYYAPKGVTAVCNYCGKTITAKSINGKLYINSLNGKIVIHKVLPRNKLNIATAYEEMGFLYRMMNRFNEAQEAFDQAVFGINDLLKSDPDNLEYLRLKSLIFFRKAEAYQAEGFKNMAKKFYEDCVLIDQKTDASEHERKMVTELLLKLED